MARKRIKDILKEVGLEEADRRLQEQNREIERLKHFESRVNESRPERLGRALQDNRNIWLQNYTGSLRARTIYIDDPIYRQVLIDREIAPIFQHPIVQRLAHIKQLSFSYLTFPAATHSRLSHSLGVCKNAELALTRILQKGLLWTAEGIKKIDLTEEQKRKLIVKAKVAGLLHDLGHGPFGHGLDQYVTAMTDEPSPDKFYASAYVSKYLADTINSCGIDVNEILAILDSKRRSELDGYDTLVSNLIDSPLDVDRMDYLVRDAHMTGLSIGTVNIHALIERMVPFQGSIQTGGVVKNQVILVFEPSATPYITHLLYARDSMYLNCYEHPGKVVAEKMLTRAVDQFSQKNNNMTIDDLVLLTDEELLKVLMEFSDSKDISYKYAYALMRNIPFEEVFAICPKKRAAYETKKDAQRKEGKEIAREQEDVPPKPAERIENWEADSLNYKDRNLITPGSWESKIATQAGLEEADRWKVVVTVPSAASFEPKFDEIKILAHEDDKYSYRKLDVMTGFWEGVLKHLAVERYIIRVFASSDLPAERITQIQQAASELLIEPE